MQEYNVTGMTCAACVSRVEKAVNKVKGVESCTVSLLTNSMGVNGDVKAADIIKAVEDAGYGASLKGHDIKEDEDVLADKETPLLKKRLFVSMGFWLVLMYFSMGHMLFGWPLPSFFNGNHVAMGLLQLLLTVIIMVINQKFFISGYKSLWHRSPNMDTLVALGSSAAFIYSTVILFLMSDAMVKGDMNRVMIYMDEFYFESAATILTLITLGKMLEARSKGKTTDALKSLMKLSPKKATLLRDGKEVEVLTKDIMVGDIMVVRAGEAIPVDAKIIEGNGAIDESMLTGESIPADKAVNDSVYAGTINLSGYLKCEAIKIGEDTTLANIIKMVNEASMTKAPIARIADKISGIFVPAVMSIAFVTAVVWLILGKEIGFALSRAIAVLVISCPCALGLATPVAIMVGNGVGARNGILFKTAVSLENAGKTEIVVLDKTGTITKGEMAVTDIITDDKKELLEVAMALESKSEHPLSKAIMKLESDGKIPEISDFKVLAGNGLEGRIDDTLIYGGSYSYIKTKVSLNEEYEKRYLELSNEGKTPVFFLKGEKVLGLIAIADTIRDDSIETIAEMRKMGIHVVMLTGDNQRTAKAIGDKAHVDEVIAEVLPDGKERVISGLKSQGKVMMVGDGINDAPALVSADIGVAIGAGTDVAIDAADIVLMKSSLKDVSAAIRLSRSTLKNIHENLFWAFFYNTIGIPLAAGLFGLSLNPMFAAAAMSLSSFCVVSNALRLNFVKIYDGSHDHKILKKKKEKKNMTKTLKIEGMMCMHCEAHVKKALEGLDGVLSAEVSFKTGEAIVTLEKEVNDDILKKTVTDEGYTVKEIN